ncbi:hypothetical protein ACFQ0F_10270 [Paraperlucidibaca wandonensis]|jgi:hypothetical protein|uniref:Uncharacterized protein n=1 Tax=Paraperlucidibaca wandonensis TaxID=1268273 RepID=A0ABW3HJ34_9GAMM|nr:hypothetical protein [Paraperlucidibaca sp.]MBQ0843109.1 hypothetical protein [Paraperlucidibaca sp.]|tara:strand:- start:1066 stop:1347 length:282 start_codon:yes stop_codon:yes gene_type:complete
MLTKLDQWYFSAETNPVVKRRYLVFMLIAFIAVMASFSPLFVGNRIGAAVYVSTFIFDLYLQLRLPLRCKFPMSFLVGAAALIAAGLIMLAGD